MHDEQSQPYRAPAGTAGPGAVALGGAGALPVVLVMVAMLGFSTQDMVVKLLSDEISLWQLLFVRSLLTLWLLVIAATVMGRLAMLAPRSWLWPLLRALFMAGAVLAFFASLPFLPLATAATGFFMGPLFITLLAALFLGEPIGPRRLVAVAAGFAGVLLIVRPGAAGWQPVTILPVLSGLFYALALVATRWRCRDEPDFALTLIHNLVLTLIGVAGVAVLSLWPVEGEAVEAWPFLLAAWRDIGAFEAGLLFVTGAAHLVAVWCSVRAYQSDDASRIAPYEYTYLALMALYDIVLFGIWPDAMTLAGMGLITGAGVFVAWREGRPPRPQIHPRGEEPWTPETEDAETGA